MSFDPKDACFLGLGTSAVAYYRCMLPAMALGCDWSGVAGVPPDLQYMTGMAKGDSKLVDLSEYKVVVLQQPSSKRWFGVINDLQAQGIKVLFEVDDYLHGIKNVLSHDFRENYDKKLMSIVETAMKMCDGIICSTEFIAKRYKKFGRTFVCENGLDLGRYSLEKPERDTINIGWAGATGHREALAPWLRAIYDVMRLRDDVSFVSVGQGYASAIEEGFPGQNRTINVPWCQVEQYPAAMTMFDIAIGPAGKGAFFRGKSDLRWLEAGALGTPIVADPLVYPNINHGVNGFHADDPMTLTSLLTRLVDDGELRTRVGESAKTYVHEHRAHTVTAEQWVRVFEEIVD